MNRAFIPIRCGSKSIHYKNIKEINGKPLIYWTLKSIEESKSIDKVYVALDCQEFSDVVNSFSFSKVEIYFRDDENAQDTSSTESVMLEFLNKNNFDINDYLFLVQATSPLTTSNDFDKALKQLEEETNDSLLTCTLDKSFYWKNNGTPINYEYLKRPRRQDFDGVYRENGAFYINKIGNILRDKNRLSGKISIYKMPEYTAYEIDEPHDWVIISELLKVYRSDS